MTHSHRNATLFVVISTLLAGGVTCGRSDITPTAPTAITPFGALRAEPPSTTGTMHDFQIRPRELRGGDWTSGTVFLNSPAPEGGLVVSLASSKREARIPDSFTIPAGDSRASFSFSTADVSADMEVLVTATIGTDSRWVQMRLLPPTATPAPVPSPSPIPEEGTGTVTLSALIN